MLNQLETHEEGLHTSSLTLVLFNVWRSRSFRKACVVTSSLIPSLSNCKTAPCSAAFRFDRATGKPDILGGTMGTGILDRNLALVVSRPYSTSWF